jgi:outer membrane biosynthesis protein TonB
MVTPPQELPEVPEPEAEPAPEPDAEPPEPEPAPEAPAPEPEAEPAPEPEAEPAPEPDAEPAPEPAKAKELEDGELEEEEVEEEETETYTAKYIEDLVIADLRKLAESHGIATTENGKKIAPKALRAIVMSKLRELKRFRD